MTPSGSDSGGGFNLSVAPEAMGGIAAAAASVPFLASAFSTPNPPPQAPAQPTSMYAPEPPAPAPEPPAPAQPRSAYEPPPPEPAPPQPAAQSAQPLAQYAQGFGAAPEEQPYQEDQPYQPEPAPQPNGGIASLQKNYSPYYGGLGGNFEELSDWMQYQ